MDQFHRMINGKLIIIRNVFNLERTPKTQIIILFIVPFRRFYRFQKIHHIDPK